jgi:Spy/CpxP family protein refolding chaperone
MHPGVFYRWKRARDCGAQQWAGACHGSEEQHEPQWDRFEASGPGSPFGVRRPLRFMAHKLELDDEQIQKLAGILNELKTERAQAAVDDQRSIAAIAKALEGDAFDQAKAKEALELRVKSAERLRDAVLTTLERTHAMLTPDQRATLAYLLRSGVLSI